MGPIERELRTAPCAQHICPTYRAELRAWWMGLYDKTREFVHGVWEHDHGAPLVDVLSKAIEAAEALGV